MILCEMALQNQFNYCLKIRKLKLRVTIQNLNQFFMKMLNFLTELDKDLTELRNWANSGKKTV